jgi:hypothetical protein
MSRRVGAKRRPMTGSAQCAKPRYQPNETGALIARPLSVSRPSKTQSKRPAAWASMV